jgi:sugar O-acyltransferase (sialic acid O-acetyltransferase NeuD family)
MSARERVILIGGFHQMIELCELCGKDILGIVDNRLSGTYWGHVVFGGDEIAGDLGREYAGVPLVISPDSPAVRKSLVELYGRFGFTFCSLVSPKAMVSPSARIGSGAIIESGAFVNTAVTIGPFARINMGANIMHDSDIGAFTTVAPNAVILGRVRVGDAAYVGANATVMPGRRMGAGSTAGAGAVVTRDVADGVTVVGNPARPLERR